MSVTYSDIGDLVSVSGATSIALPIPAGAGPGDILISAIWLSVAASSELSHVVAPWGSSDGVSLTTGPSSPCNVLWCQFTPYDWVADMPSSMAAGGNLITHFTTGDAEGRVIAYSAYPSYDGTAGGDLGMYSPVGTGFDMSGTVTYDGTDDLMVSFGVDDVATVWSIPGMTQRAGLSDPSSRLAIFDAVLSPGPGGSMSIAPTSTEGPGINNRSVFNVVFLANADWSAYGPEPTPPPPSSPFTGWGIPI